MARERFLRAVLAVGLTAPLVPAADPPATAAQRDQQKQATAAVEQTARFVTTSLRTLAYQKLDPTTEQKVLAEVAGGLRKLSRDEMQAVFTHLDAAVKAPDEASATAEQKAAYDKHREVVAGLRGILFKMDALRTLDEAAKRLTDAAKAEHALHLRSTRAEAQRAAGVRRAGKSDEVREQTDGQVDVRTDVGNLLKQLNTLRPKLSADQRGRLDAADAAGRGAQLVRSMDKIVTHLQSANYPPAAEEQLAAARELQALAAALTAPRDPLTAMKDARDMVEQARRLQEALVQETENRPDVPRQRTDRARQEVARDQAAKLADQQAKIEFDTREARKALEPAAKDLAAKLTPAESEMRRAQEALRKPDAKSDDGAADAEKSAVEKLTDARDELDKRIATAELAKADALTATKNAAEQVDKLIKDQKAAQEMTQKVAKRGDPLKPAAKAQADVAKQAEAAKAMPLADNPEAKKALEDAAEAAQAAADKLDEKDAALAKADQQKTVDALEAAKKALDDKAAAIEKRRDDIAKLEKAADKLGDLAKDEQKVADAAKADKPDAADLAKQQGELTPPTKAAADAVRDEVPEAAKKADAAGEKQADAETKLGEKDAPKAAEAAAAAAKDLKDAQAEVNKKLDGMKAAEIADQQALQPDKVSPQDAASQVAKAVDQANQAASAAKKAAAETQEATGPADKDDLAAKRLADLQKKLAEKANQAGQTDGGKPAGEAAESLNKSDLLAAMDEQQKALEQFEKAAAGDDKKAAEKGEKLAAEQKKLMAAAAALQKSAEATAAAKAALAQAQASAPAAVKPQLDAAAEKLDQAAADLADGKPGEAGKGQQQAADQLGQALSALNAAAQAKGDQPSQPGQPQQAKAGPPMPGTQPGQTPGDTPGTQPGQPQPGQAAGTGDRKTFEEDKKSASGGRLNTAGGSFIDLQKQEREKVQQSLEAAFPAAFRELIKQYNLNIKKAPPAAPPAKP